GVFTIIAIVLLGYYSIMYDAALQGLRLFKWMSVVAIVTTIVKLIGGLLSYRFPAFPVIVFSLILTVIIKLICEFFVLHKKIPGHINKNAKLVEKSIFQ